MSASRERRAVRTAVRDSLVIGLVALIVVAVPAFLWIRHVAMSQELSTFTERSEVLAEQTLAPLVDEGLLAGNAESLAALDRAVDERIANGSLLRLKIWDAGGTIIYSDEERLVGERFPLPDSVEQAFRTDATAASITTAQRPEHLYESELGTMVEIYTSEVSAAGERFMFEAYYPSDAILITQRGLLLALLPAAVVALLLMHAAQVPLAARLARRAQRADEARRKLLGDAVEASAVDRRRIARNLRDSVIQDLAGLSYALEALEPRAGDDVRPLIMQGRTILQGDVKTVSGMLTELNWVDFDRVGLADALAPLADPLRERQMQVRLEVPTVLEMDRASAAVLYRAVQEALSNTLKHSGARNVTVALCREGDTARLTVTDDGAGFDAEAPRHEEHLGLRLIHIIVGQAGGTIDIKSQPGMGTSVSVVLPLD
jgi:two-component system, NarL family, sensor kinase